MSVITQFWRFLLEVYLGDRGFRVALVTYAAGFWIFGAGAIIFLIWPENPPPVAGFFRSLFTNIGLIFLVFMTYPVLRCSFRKTDPTRPKNLILRVMIPTIVGALAPFYLIGLITSFVFLVIAPTISG